MIEIVGTVLDIKKELFKLDENKEYDCVIKEHKEKRSSNANAYFHVLVNKIAQAVKMSEEEVKVKMVLEYGTIARDRFGKPLSVIVPSETDISKFYPYSKFYKTKNNLDIYIFYKRTHLLDRKEMSDLINGVVNECRSLKIPTLDDEKLQQMIDEWGI